VTKRNPSNVAASVRQRLLNRSRETGEVFDFLLQRYAAERFLYRLGVSRHRERYVLKGAMLLPLWGGSLYRPTRDLDFTGYGSADIEEISAIFRELCSVPVEGDGVVFEDETLTAEPIRDDTEYHGLRLKFRATLDSAKIQMQIDVGFGNAIEPGPERVTYPTLLNAPPPQICAYPPEAVVAEKLHAMVVLGERNSRLRDFYDVFVLSQQFPFLGEPLSAAIAATFERRRAAITADVPVALTPRFYSDAARSDRWRAYLKSKQNLGAPSDLSTVGETLIRFLLPVVRAISSDGPLPAEWPPGGPWRNTGLLYAPYPNYVASQLDWIEEIPAHWRIERLRRVLKSNPSPREIRQMAPDTLVSFLPMEAIGEYGGLALEINKPIEECGEGFTYFRDGDVLVAKITPCFENGKGALAAGLTNGIGFGTTELHVLRPGLELDPRFLFYVSISDHFRQSGTAEMYGAGGQKRVPEEFIRNMKHPLPPIEEQRAIARFLDRETAKIDALIGKKERLIELLRERRSAGISRSVTKGLDSNVTMKNSGIEWLGSIPSHWALVPSTWLFKESRQRAFEGDQQLSATQKYGVIPQADFERLESRQVVHVFMNLDQRKHVEIDDFVMSMRSFEGGLERARARGCVRSSYVVLKASTDVHTGFYSHLFKSTAYIQALRATSTFIRDGQDLNFENFRLVKLPLPPRAEQEKIAALLDREIGRIDRQLARVRDAMDGLRELRSALISAAVTGKIDVREEVV
jgi:type I restriction enzyme S subunit